MRLIPMKTPLTLSNLQSVTGKIIIWAAEAYRDNCGYHGRGLYGGKERILSVDLSARRPIISSEKIDPKSDDLTFAFIDDHSLIQAGKAYRYLKADGTNNCLSFSDSDREIFFEIVDEN